MVEFQPIWNILVTSQIGSWNQFLGLFKYSSPRWRWEKLHNKKKTTFRNLKLHSIPKERGRLCARVISIQNSVPRHSIQRSRSHLVRFLPLYLAKLQAEELWKFPWFGGAVFPLAICGLGTILFLDYIYIYFFQHKNSHILELVSLALKKPVILQTKVEGNTW